MWTNIEPKIMLVDMNSFFASVEQQANPFLRGKPVGVCASLHETSCIIGTSREMKALGIKNGFPTYKAKRTFPNITLLEAEPEKYREVNRKIVKIFQDYTDKIDVYSVDEAFMQFEAGPADLMLIGAQIKKRIRQEVGDWLTCSVGIAPNRFMAKLAADMQKPDGLSIIWRENLPELYKQKEFGDLWGINRGWTKRLNQLGIWSPLQMLNYPVANLMAAYGKPGFYIWQRVNGLEIDNILSRHSEYREESKSIIDPSASPQDDENAQPKSFGHSWVLNFRSRDKERLKPVIMRLAEKAARRMRAEGFKASGIYLSMRAVDGNFFYASRKLKTAIITGYELYLSAMNLWKNWEFKSEIMHIAVGFNYLQKNTHQLDLFDGKNPALIKTLDLINNRYGEFTIRSGMLTHTGSFAPDAIAFGK